MFAKRRQYSLNRRITLFYLIPLIFLLAILFLYLNVYRANVEKMAEATFRGLADLMHQQVEDNLNELRSISEFSWLGNKYSKPVYKTKDALVNEDSIYPIDRTTYGFSSDTQNMMTEINYKSILANSVVAEGDLEENWKNAIAEYAYIVDPAVAELNELFGTK